MHFLLGHGVVRWLGVCCELLIIRYYHGCILVSLKLFLVHKLELLDWFVVWALFSQLEIWKDLFWHRCIQLLTVPVPIWAIIILPSPNFSWCQPLKQLHLTFNMVVASLTCPAITLPMAPDLSHSCNLLSIALAARLRRRNSVVALRRSGIGGRQGLLNLRTRFWTCFNSRSCLRGMLSWLQGGFYHYYC